MNQLIINARESEKRLAVLENGKLSKLYIEQPQQRSRVGNIYLGIVENVLTNLNAAFVHLGHGKKGYLQLKDLPKNRFDQGHGKSLAQGEKLLVQVVKDKSESKEYRVTANLEFSSDLMVYLPFEKTVSVSKKIGEPRRNELRELAHQILNEDEGMIFRTAAEDTANEVLITQFLLLKEQFENIKTSALRVQAPHVLFEKDIFFEKILETVNSCTVDEIQCDQWDLVKKIQEKYPNIEVIYYRGKENLFTHFLVEHQIDQLKARQVPLENGAYLVIDETEACTVIDINSGQSTSKTGKETAILETNLLAAKECIRQILLRNISGMILIDFINMRNDEHRKKIISLVKSELRKDPKRTTVFGFTRAGMLEIIRERTEPTLIEQTEISCPICKGIGHVDSPESVAFQLERELWEFAGSDYDTVNVEATPDVLSLFKGEHQKHLERLERAVGLSIDFMEITFNKPHYHIKSFR